MISWLQHAKTRLQLFAEHKDTLHPISERNDVGLGNKVKYFFSETICKWGKDLANQVKMSKAQQGWERAAKNPRLLNAIFKSSLLLWIELGIYIMLYNSTTWLELHYRFIGVLQREEMGKVQVDCFLWVPNFETKRKKNLCCVCTHILPIHIHMRARAFIHVPKRKSSFQTGNKNRPTLCKYCFKSKSSKATLTR